MSLSESFGPHMGEDTGEWADLGRAVRSDPDGVWTRLLAVVSTTDDEGLFWVGDVIEDLIWAHGWAMVPRIEDELPKNPRLRRAFLHVSASHSDEELEERFYLLRAKIETEFGVS